MARTDRPIDLAISEQELTGLTGELTEVHEASLPALRQATSEWREAVRARSQRGFSRRSFLTSAGAVVAGGVVLSSPAGATALRAAGPAGRGAAASLPLDVTVAALAASLENLAVATYNAGLAAATAGKLGTVPPAVGTFVTTAKSQHGQHAAAWNSIVVAAGYKRVTAVDPVIAKVVNTDFAKVSTIPGLLKLALTLEDVAAATYLEAIEAVTDPAAIRVAASIQPVEMQHAAILNFVLGSYPVPAAFATLTGAASTSDVAHLKVTKA